MQQGGGETLWFARGETVWAPKTALKTPFPFNPPHNKETPSLQPLFPTLVPLPIHPTHTPLCRVPCPKDTHGGCSVPLSEHPRVMQPPWDKQPPHRPAQKRLCAMAWSRDVRGLRSPEGPSQHPPCSPGRTGVCSGGRCHWAVFLHGSPAAQSLCRIKRLQRARAVRGSQAVIAGRLRASPPPSAPPKQCQHVPSSNHQHSAGPRRVSTQPSAREMALGTSSPFSAFWTVVQSPDQRSTSVEQPFCLHSVPHALIIVLIKAVLILTSLVHPSLSCSNLIIFSRHVGPSHSDPCGISQHLSYE